MASSSCDDDRDDADQNLVVMASSSSSSSKRDQECQTVDPIELQRQTGWTFYLMYSIFAAILGTSFMGGFHSGVINASYNVMNRFVNESFYLENDKSLTTSELSTQWSLVVSFFVIGGAVGSFWIPEAMANHYGRKTSLIYTSPIGIFGSVLCFIAPYSGGYILLIVGRTLCGVHAGIALTILPAFLIEIAPIHLRGACGSFSELPLNFGIVFANFLGLSRLLGTTTLWPLLFVISTACHFGHTLFMLISAESPRWLIDMKRDEGAMAVVRKLRRGCNDDVITMEFEETKIIARIEAAIKCFSLAHFIHFRQLWWPLLLGINLHLSQQFSGIAAVRYYSSKVMIKTGLDEETAKLANLFVSLVNILAAIISTAMVDKVGRRFLMLLGLAGVAISNIFLTTVLSFNQRYLSIAGFAIFLFSFSIGPGPIPWFMSAEMFSHGARPLALSVCLFVNWTANFMVNLLFPQMQHYLHDYAFLPFAVWSFAEFLFLFAFLPETSCVTVEEVVAKFEPGQSLLQFKPPSTSSSLAIISSLKSASRRRFVSEIDRNPLPPPQLTLF